jgi:hypothetical protein
MTTSLVLLYAFAALAIATGVIGVLAWRGWRKQRDGIDGPPSVPPSDWHDVTQRYRESRIEALRDWMGEDHELAQQLPQRDGSASRPGALPTDRPAAPAPRERGPLSKAIHPAGTSPLVPTGNGPYSRQADHPVSQPMESRALATRRGLYDRFA